MRTVSHYGPCDHESCMEIAISSDDGTLLCNQCDDGTCDCEGA